ncbi:tRNA (adenosine(37)-N6)-threonylcarbamoyltransferase complex dimerization subunit type 1 TsaB [Candidatus Dependentiae bacterium]|jgi:tRNA threonylcarbamoyladenosine biosynthesis protein TsaB|nr:tRNA (adenosine(37)-N6)-threonylcarbamoyltransferase complex dimerization subunit type 1 TsaB [Candidatus Dependentiae bacterium]
MKKIYLGIQATYNTTDIALFEDENCLEQFFRADLKASSHLIPYLDSLLRNNGKTLSDLAFIALDKGPGAFTTLRVTIATLNGIAFAHKIPLIGIDGLEALTYEQLYTLTAPQKNFPITIASLLNAYSNDVYFMISEINNGFATQIDYGCKNIDIVLESLASRASEQKIFFTGNGALLHQERISTKFTRCEITPTSTANAKTIAHLGLSNFIEHKNCVDKILPNYVKTQLFNIKK